MIEKVSVESSEESSTHKEVIRTIAAGVNSLKSKLVSVTNKNKKMWRAVAKNAPDTVSSLIREQLEDEAGDTSTSMPAGRYNLRSTPTRRASAAYRTLRQSAKPVASQLHAEERPLSGNEEEFTKLTDKGESQVCVSDENRTADEAGELITDDKVTADSKPEEPSMCDGDQHLATITVPITDIERAKQMAQQLTALITNLEHQQSSTFDSLT